MNMFKKNGGFTLVELIVVIAILAILAGVAVPAYSGYITKANNAKDMQVLSAINTAAQGIAAAEGVTITGITVTKTPASGAANIVVTCSSGSITQAEIEAYTGAFSTLAFSSKFASATWASGEWTITNS